MGDGTPNDVMATIDQLLARRQQSPMYRTVRSNMQVVLGPDASAVQLARVVQGAAVADEVP